MQILLLGGLLSTLLLAPMETYRVYQRAYEWEHVQITIDNAGIVLGQADRNVINYLVVANSIVRAMEVVHHPIHVCARVPATAAQCSPEDQALESELQSFHALTRQTATAMWNRSFASAMAHLRGEGVTLSNWRRPSLNLKGRRCPVCGMEPFWELADLEGETPSSYLRAMFPVPIDVIVRLRGKTLLSGEKWDYFLEASEAVL